ncbi:hypothetical protein [Flagellimonas pacifica]|uniref:Uncharacterized protein n=1 Tax=Flagellimonas pacifica TaxID=1247520 RepID=A0A285MXY9_9FLAO|nr:hypothetical protein [Allomuricauda parva]SNZ01417.1 hypothetical protein SAMN06265377_3255 [Allomuricauda parva]
MEIQNFVKDLNKDFFNGALSPAFTEQLLQLPMDRPDVFAMVQRMFGFMNQAGFPAQDLSVMVGEVMGTLLARILPGAWEGRVPPITVPGRHKAIDHYIKNTMGGTATNRSMLDIGCGFPPYTTLETPELLSNWQITAVDPSLPVYLVYDENENYATFDENKKIVYFQPAIPSVENWNALLSDVSSTRNRFQKLLEQLLDQPGLSSKIKARLERDPAMGFETDKLSFVRGSIGEVAVAPVDCIRCFNVLFYFDDTFFKTALKWFETRTNENGIVLVGGNWAASSECYYHVYQKMDGRLIEKEFAFSIDTLCPFGVATWYANHDDDRQTAQLVHYLRIIRKDSSFMNAFYALNDRLREKYQLCARDADGYYGNVDPSISPLELWQLVEKIINELNEAGFNQKAADVLNREGLNARVNEVGHIAIVPHT